MAEEEEGDGVDEDGAEETTGEVLAVVIIGPEEGEVEGEEVGVVVTGEVEDEDEGIDCSPHRHTLAVPRSVDGLVSPDELSNTSSHHKRRLAYLVYVIIVSIVILCSGDRKSVV